MIKNIVDYIIKVSCKETTSGNYNIYFDEITKHLNGITTEFLQANYSEIINELDTRPEILSETWESIEGGEVVGFDVNLCLDYCPNFAGEF